MSLSTIRALRWSPLIGLLALWMLLPTASAQDVKLSGLVFGDGYWVAAHDDADLENQNGVWFRRVYLTADFGISDAWSARVRTEMNSPGDFKSGDKLVPSAKDLYLRWKGERHQIYLGLSSTPTWKRVEDFWGYRAVEKTLVDLQKLGSSRDIGVAASGSLDPEKKLLYHVMVGNGGGTKAETNKGKKAMASLALHPTKNLVLEFYGDVEDRPGVTRYTLQGFAGLRFDRGRLGVQYVFQRHDNEDAPHAEVSGLSVFGATRLSERVNGFARFDRMFDVNPDADKIAYLPFFDTARSNLVILGIDIAAHEQVHFMPNVEVVFYDEDGDAPAPDATVMPRVTFFFTF